MSIFRFERSTLRRLGFAFLGADGAPGVPQNSPTDGPEDYNDPYLAQAAQLSASGRAFPAAPDPTEAG